MWHVRNQWSVIQGRRVGEWHRKHRSASSRARQRTTSHGPTVGARLLRRSPKIWEMDGEARLLPERPLPQSSPAAREEAMATEVLERRFAAIGARVKVIRTAR
jgi:hypothetical protein